MTMLASIASKLIHNQFPPEELLLVKYNVNLSKEIQFIDKVKEFNSQLTELQTNK